MVRENMIRPMMGRLGALILVVLVVVRPASPRTSQSGNAVVAARHVIERVIGPRSASFTLALTPSRDSLETFSVEAHDGLVSVHGNSAVALVRGVYHYLRSMGLGMVAWSGSRIDLPRRLPDCPRVVVSTPFRFRQYFNVCTFGYSTVWWDWPRWEREIDWMALHGINMPLALVGQMGVWERVWESFGIPRDSLQTFFVGPAFLPWHWMGNIDRHEGPLPQSWIDSQEALQKKILGRLRELGMTPVVPAFSGFVPESFRRHFPAESISEHRHWSSLPDSDRTFALTPGSALFQEIGERFIKEYRRTFGPCSYYLADSFNELDVPVSVEHRYDELAGYGNAVYQSIRRGDSTGVWVMQGWLFSNASSFWDSASTRALLSRVPNDRMIILDLANEQFHGWKVHKGFYGKEWVYSIIHNFGGNNPLRGRLAFVATDPPIALHDPARGNLVGYGLAPEGIENNEVIYELLTDMGWRSEPVKLDAWIHDYCVARYGSVTPVVERAWSLLDEAVYSRTNGHHVLFAFQHRPSLSPWGETFKDPRVDTALGLMIDDAGRYATSLLYRNDLIDVAVYAVGNKIDTLLALACHAHIAADTVRRDSLANIADILMHRLDAVVNVRPDQRLERWISTARKQGTSKEERDLFERNARRQITVWGGPDLHDYAAKLWGGMVRDFYAGRWRLFFSLLRQGTPMPAIQERLRLWEESWGTQTALSSPENIADPVAAIRSLGIEESIVPPIH
ncbi:MAG TPA: alpha-N-acetylglucosaminidase [Bacteroidota bacterium]|nr:alpha-N-acetylglucosaminidase [Bacteroidota bacterium]